MICTRPGEERCRLPIEHRGAESYGEYVDGKLESILYWATGPPVGPRSASERHPLVSEWIFDSLEGLCCPSCWEYYERGDCQRCGAAGAGALGISVRAETPSGDCVEIPAETVLCDDCLETTVDDLETHGGLQPTLESYAGGSA